MSLTGTVVARHVYGITHGSIMGLTFCGRSVGPKWLDFPGLEDYDCRQCKRADALAEAGRPSRGKWGQKS